jgi:hypothetical protein
MSKTIQNLKYEKDREYNYESLQKCYDPSIEFNETQEEKNKKIISDKLFSILKKSPKKEKFFSYKPEMYKNDIKDAPITERYKKDTSKSESYKILYEYAKLCGITLYKNEKLKTEDELRNNFKIMLKYIYKVEKLKENTEYTEEENIFKVNTVKEVAKIFRIPGIKRKNRYELKQEILLFLDK